MEPVDREGNGLGKETGAAEQGPEQEHPILEPFFSDDPRNNDESDECGQVVGSCPEIPDK
jgi:hypothetical protein